MTIALVGNPNAGKTALFNALTGFRRHVANYPGVTVDVGRGRIRKAARPLELLDLPGTYSLAANSPDETIVCDALHGRLAGQEPPAAILAIVDASNPHRNFYLVSQLLEVGLPLVIAFNMIDIAQARGIHVDTMRLAQRLGVPILPVIATQPKTTEPLVAALEKAVGQSPPSARVGLPQPLRREALRLCELSRVPLAFSEALRLLADHGGYAEQRFVARGGQPELIAQARLRLAADGLDPARVEIQARYDWINRLFEGLVERRPPPGPAWSRRLDRILTHRAAGALILCLALYGVFYAIYAGAQPLIDLASRLFAWMAALAAAVLPEGAVESLIVDGLIGGVGGVLSFLPQILILFLFIGILEDCGYLARAAFMVDRLMRPLGLSGRAFIPLLSSFACAVPAIMGTRVIADRRERLLTILIAPFMSCAARLPIYVLLIGALVPQRSWLGGWVRLDTLVMLAMYLVGVFFAIPVALLLKRTLLAGPPGTFLLELPSYKFPHWRTVLQRAYLAGRNFLVRAGTVILLVNLAVWALGYFPRSPHVRQALEHHKTVLNWDDARFKAELAGAYLRDSFLARMGRLIEPAIRPLGWDWRIGVGVLASFPAREVVIATLGTVLNLEAPDQTSPSLREAIRRMTWEDSDKPVFTLPVALSVMVFFALCAQCTGTLVVIGRETRSWLWPMASFLGMSTLAYAAAWAVFAGAAALGL